MAAVLAIAIIAPVVAVVAVVGLGLRASAPMGVEAPEVTVLPSAASPVESGAVETGSAKAAGPRVSPAWVSRTAAAAGIPEPAMRAYGQAELALASEVPGCRLGWPTLAGLGWVESQHGTIDGRTLGADGRSSTPVLGPVLDGHAYAAIRPTEESTAVHGNSEWDHAVGPLQFIGKSWSRWGTDGDGDGEADPLDLDDAALAAARYLCADRHDLRTASGWTAAVRSYNHSDDYVRAVSAAANSYVSRVSH